jgi:glutamyl-tRNA synthetase
MTSPVRTRFAPSPTGFLHIGGARTALFSWAYARRHGGMFVLRIEDTDLERSTQASIQAILDGMSWLGLRWDEGPFFQMQRIERYREAAEGLLRDGNAYWCYASKEELEAMREAQRLRGEKPRYDGRWRPENAAGQTPPLDIKPVLRFRNPLQGVVAWDDLVKGRIEIDNHELDDLVLLRGDGVPTYNFGVVVDDLDMDITHVIRGDDHVNNTPRQINIYRALGATVPQFAHVPMILGADGERLSKRHGAVSVMQYEQDGYLPEAMVNYLARLGWSHGNEEVFSTGQFIEWFDLGHISRSPAQFNPEKLKWINEQHIRALSDSELAEKLKSEFVPIIEKGQASSVASGRVRIEGASTAEGAASAGGTSTVEAVGQGLRLEKAVSLYKSRVATLNELADAVRPFYVDVHPSRELLAQHLNDAAKAALSDLRSRFAATAASEWNAGVLARTVKDVIAAHKLKMPQLAIPLRVVLTGQTNTPSIDAVLEAMGRELVLGRLSKFL